MSGHEEQGFLEQVAAEPEDDAIRLIYADWLEDNGQLDRAEFIRLQIERASLPKWDARQLRMRVREAALLNEHEIAWRANLPKLEGVHWGGFRRGFVATANFRGFADLKQYQQQCWDAAPLESININWPQSRDNADHLKPIRGLRELSILDSYATENDANRLAMLPLLAGLHTLNILQCNLESDGFAWLVGSPHLANLRALRVPFNAIGNVGIEALWQAESLTSLAELDLAATDSYNRYNEDPVIDTIGVRSLATWPGLRNVRSLTLSGNAVRYGGLKAILQSKQTRNLKELYIRDNGYDGGTMMEFEAAHPDLQLDVLDLGENMLMDSAAEYLAGAASLRELKVLHLDRCELHLSGALRLAEANFFESLRRLNLGENRVEAKGLKAILERCPPHLHTLQIADNNLYNDGAQFLAEMPLPELQSLDVSRNGLGDHGAELFSNSPHFEKLLILRMLGNNIGPNAALELTQNSKLGKQLVSLHEDKEFDHDCRC